MYFLGFIALLVIIFVLSGMNSRLRKVEEQLKTFAGQGKVPVSPTISAAPASPSAHAGSIASVSQPVTSPDLTNANKTGAAVPVTKVSSEEASGRLLGRIGIAAVIIGISFFLKYAFDNNWIGPAGRVMIGIFAGVVLLALGQYLRRKYAGYSDLLMGGGIGVLYLSIFSAYSFYSLISPFTAGALMLVVTALAFAVSIVDATIVLALVGTVGGFATPFLVASGMNSMSTLFVYLTILNLGILGVSFFKKWPVLSFVAFAETLINFVSWFGAHYSSQVLGPTIFFCFITFIIFLVAGVSRAAVAKTEADPLNYFLVGGNALFMALIGYVLLKPDYEGILGFAAVVIALVYMIVAFMVNKSNPSDQAMNIFLPGLAVAFLSAAVPLQFSGPWVAAAWLIESIFLYIIASVISNRGFQVMGVVVYGLGLLNAFAFNFPRGDWRDFVVFFNSHFIIIVLAILVAYAISYMYYRYGSLTVETQKRGIAAFVIIANILTVYAFSSQIILHYNARSAELSEAFYKSEQQASLYNTGYDNSDMRTQERSRYYAERESIQNRSNTLVSIFWALYAALLTIIGFSGRIVNIRRLGLILFIITAFKVFVNVWSLGQIYRIVSFIVFGIVALAASFIYVRFKDRLKEMV